MIIGLTGGTGTGKTTISALFEQKGFKVIDFDKVTHEVYAPGSACINEISAAFGKEILLPDGSLNRRQLGEIVFADKKSLDTLNDIVYKYILAHTNKTIKAHKDKKLLLDAPTLFEAGLNKICDCIIGVIARKDIKISRVSVRDSLDTKSIEERINSQKPDSFYRDNCDFIIENNEGFRELEIQVNSIFEKLHLRTD